jgi:HAD superfamily hydrolase (TIGR01549 family)
MTEMPVHPLPATVRPAIRLVILDFDGVILDSVGIKTEAYHDLFLDHPRELDRIMEYHLANLGTSRFEKIRYVYHTILGKELPPEEFEALLRRYADLVLAKVLQAPFIPGAPEFLERFHRRLPLFVVSGTPEDEIRFIVRERGLDRFFRGVYGSPRGKTDYIHEILAATGVEPGRALYVGDAPNDLHAAEAAGIRFAGRVAGGAPDPFVGEKSVERVVKDLFELGQYLEDLKC